VTADVPTSDVRERRSALTASQLKDEDGYGGLTGRWLLVWLLVRLRVAGWICLRVLMRFVVTDHASGKRA
jgi:hypothetical protein